MECLVCRASGGIQAVEARAIATNGEGAHDRDVATAQQLREVARAADPTRRRAARALEDKALLCTGDCRGKKSKTEAYC